MIWEAIPLDFPRRLDQPVRRPPIGSQRPISDGELADRAGRRQRLAGLARDPGRRQPSAERPMEHRVRDEPGELAQPLMFQRERDAAHISYQGRPALA